jgi:MoxR-like ATPase
MPTAETPEHNRDDFRAAGELAESYRRIRTEIGKLIIGQDSVVEELLIGLFARGHVLLVGVPGLAKTLLVSTVARISSLSFRRIQFTPDMMPSDITGTDILQDDPETGRRKFSFIAGPIFANMILADEINRTPPKTQAALLEAMQERHVSAGGVTYPLPEPFFVLATQNPIEQEGTYPLPEAQLDRFMLNVLVKYPSSDEELEILKRTTGDETPELAVVLTAEEIVAIQHLVRRIPVPDYVFQYARDLVRASRPQESGAGEMVRKCVSWGAGPRAGQSLILAAKTRAVLNGRLHASVADVREVAKPVLRHRIVTTFHAEAEGISPEQIIERLMDEVPAESEKAAGRLVGSRA